MNGDDLHMVDPLSLGAGAAALGRAVAGDSEGKQWLVSRIFGPAADEIGAWLGEKAHDRLRNADRIADAAQRKAGDRDGSIPPRVAKVVLDEGTWVDDELAAEYFGGMLAASVTPSGRDDRAVGWTKVISAMSVVEIRLHYLVYQEWWCRWAELDRDDIDLDFIKGSAIYIDSKELARRLLQTISDDDPTVEQVEESYHLVLHASSGLQRHGLTEALGFAFGDSGRMAAQTMYGVGALPFEFATRFTPSLSGIELWGFAHGIDNLTNGNFGIGARMVDTDSVIPRLENVVFQ